MGTETKRRSSGSPGASLGATLAVNAAYLGHSERFTRRPCPPRLPEKVSNNDSAARRKLTSSEILRRLLFDLKHSGALFLYVDGRGWAQVGCFTDKRVFGFRRVLLEELDFPVIVTLHEHVRCRQDALTRSDAGVLGCLDLHCAIPSFADLRSGPPQY